MTLPQYPAIQTTPSAYYHDVVNDLPRTHHISGESRQEPEPAFRATGGSIHALLKYSGMAVLCVGLFSGCGDQYDRMTSRMSTLANGNMTLNKVAAPAVDLYYSRRYGANARQKKAAEEAAQRYLMNHAAATPTESPRSRHAGSLKFPSRYIAVDVPRAESSKGAASVMVFDTQARQLVGNNVYEIDAKLQPRQSCVLDTYKAEYVGTGSTTK